MSSSGVKHPCLVRAMSVFSPAFEGALDGVVGEDVGFVATAFG